MSHWYRQDGKPEYTIIGVNGKQRDTTLRDARKYKYAPSVTTILQIPAKPQLEVWKQNQLLQAIIDYGKIPTQLEDEKQWKSIIREKSQKIGKDSAKRGSDIHNSLEGLLRGELDLQTDTNSDFTAPVIELLDKSFGHKTLWVPEKGFCHPLGFGGKVDLHSEDIVLDFKTKTASADFSKDLGYDEHLMQLAAYRLGLGNLNARCYNLFISTETPGLLQLKEWASDELVRGLDMFKALLIYWQLANNYKSSF